LFCGELPETGDSTTIEPRGYGRQAQGDIFKAALAYDITDALNISYTFGHTQADTSAANTAEADPINCGTVIVSFATALCNFQGFPSGDVNYDQHELRLAFENEGPFRAVLGGFILDGVDDAFSVSANVPPGETRPVIISPVTTAPQPFPERFRNFVFGDQLTTTDVKAVFAEFTYTLPNQKTRLSAEGRFTSEKIAATNMAGFDDEETFEFFTPRITLEHDLSQDSLIYVTVGRGAKAGGFNSAAVSPELRTFDPEFNWTYEIGSKNVFLEGRLTVNAAAFYTDWNNQQINAGDPLGSPFTPTLTVNRGNATVYGFELETTFQATENLSFDGAFSYTNPTFDEGTFDVVFARGVDFLGFPAPCDDVVCSSDGDVSGNTLERNPKTQIALGAQWEAAISDTMDYYIRGDVGYQSSQFADSINAAIAPSRTVVNARAGVLVGQFEVAVWARNLFDEQYVANSFQIIQSFSNNLIGTYFGERRTFGVTAQYRY
jgi:iron complex outermembrane receptor protein